MFARILSAKANLRVLETEEQLRKIGESMAEDAAVQPGIRGFYGLMDRSSGRVMTITLWATPQDLEASESSGYLRRQLERAEVILEGPVTRETFEVVVHSDLAVD